MAEFGGLFVVLGFGDGHLLFEHFVQFRGAYELVGDDHLPILFLGLPRFEYIIRLGVFFAEDAIGGLLVDEGLAVFEDGVFRPTLEDGLLQIGLEIAPIARND